MIQGIPNFNGGSHNVIAVTLLLVDRVDFVVSTRERRCFLGLAFLLAPFTIFVSKLLSFLASSINPYFFHDSSLEMTLV